MVSRWGLGRVGGVLVGASMMSRWCLGGVLAASMLIQGVHGVLVVSWWRRVGRVKKCNVVWYPITSIDQSPWSLSFAGHFC